MNKLLLFFSLLFLLAPQTQAKENEMIVKMKAPYGAFDVFGIQSQTILMQSSRRLINGLLIVKGDASSISANPAVEWAEPNYILHILSYGEDDDQGTMEGNWGLDKIQAPEVWKKGITGEGINVAVIDTGADLSHPEIAHCATSNPGWNFITKDNNPMDDNSHGTHVSGTICGKTVGVAPNVKVVPYKFLDKDGSGTTADAIDAITMATRDKVDIMSNSWGGGPFSQAMFEAIEEANKAGIWFIAAAGNSYNNNDKRPSYPASYDLPNVISVAATDNEDKKASFSNYGEKSVHVAAPGVKIYSSVPGGEYKSYSGTSMACPHVAGVVSLMLSNKQIDIKQKLIDSSDAVEGLKVIAKGRINSLKATEY